MPKIDPSAVPVITVTGYPPPHDAPCRARKYQFLGLAGGLSQFGVNLVRLKPGVWSGQRHWHTHEDEFVWVLEGQATLVTDEGAVQMGPGDCAAFPAGDENGHHFQNDGPDDALLLTIGTRSDEDGCRYPDIDMVAHPGRYKNPGRSFTRRDGSPVAPDDPTVPLARGKEPD